MNKYFENIRTLEELRKQYKEFLKMHHPDNGGNLEIMKEINAEYDRPFKILKNHSRDLYSPLCEEFIPNLVNIAHYDS